MRMKAAVVAILVHAASAFHIREGPHHAPIISPINPPMHFAIVEDAGLPVVLMHGMGDAGSNPGMQSLAKTISAKYPVRYAVAVDVANGMSSITQSMASQVAEFAKAVASDPKLANGFYAAGLSQGGLIVRAYIEQYNNPPVKRFISICGPQEGVGTCPDNILYKMICPLWKLDNYGAGIAFSGYWKGVEDKERYLSQNKWLPDVNNEKPDKNSTYHSNMVALEKYVLVEAMKDTMVVPHASESHGFWDWGTSKTVVEMKESEGYKGDWIGLKTLDDAGKLTSLSYQGDHLRFSSEFWDSQILPVFA